MILKIAWSQGWLFKYVFNVCCKLQMAAFQFPDGNSTFAFTAVYSLTLWAGYLLEAKPIQTTFLPHPDVFA